jgi:hypothetical protein
LEVSRLFSQVAEAEVKGDSAKSRALLRDIVRIDPENELAHWQLGEVQVDQTWIAAEEAQRRAAADPLQAEYRERRAAAANGINAQLAVARWAQKKGLTDESLAQWAGVLAKDPKNREALRGLDLRWQDGRLMSREQVADQKEAAREAKRAAERWESKIVGWRRAVAGQDAAACDTALREIGRINDPGAIPSLEEVTLGRESRDAHTANDCTQIAVAFIGALGNMAAQPSTESLARHAVFATDESVRRLAVEKLRPRDPYDYVPLLLSGLGMPIETSYSVTTGPDGSVHYLRSLFREGPDQDWASDSRRAVIQRDMNDHAVRFDFGSGTVREAKTANDKVRAELGRRVRTAKYQKRYANDVAVTQQRVDAANSAAQKLNSRIVPVLAQVTGENYGDNPKDWWNWWQSKNEYYATDHPIAWSYDSGADYFDYDDPPRRCSCFVKGTPVWTKLGRRPIESLELGDLVLAQDIDTGELHYRPITGRTLRPPSPIVKLSAGGEAIRTTEGHLFWTPGIGWRMAKELKKGMRVHGLQGALDLRAVELDGESEAYNLVVAGDNTYFVGSDGLLVHDNTPRRPTKAILPGIFDQ